MTPDENATINGRKTFPRLSEEAFCRLCFCNIAPELDSLCNYEKTGKHKSRAPTNNPILNVTCVTVTPARSDHNYNLKAADLQLTIAMFVTVP